MDENTGDTFHGKDFLRAAYGNSKYNIMTNAGFFNFMTKSV